MAHCVGTCLTASLSLIWVGAGFAAPEQPPVSDFSWHAPQSIAPDQTASNRIVLKLKPGVTLAHNAVALRHAATETGNLSVLRDLDDAGLIGVERLFNADDAELAARLGLDRYVRIRVGDGRATTELANSLGTLDDLVENAEVDGIGYSADTHNPLGGVGDAGSSDPADFEPPNDIMFPVQYALHNKGQSINGQTGKLNSDINAAKAWSVSTGSDKTIIAILDSGVSMSHPDLTPKLLPGYNFHGINFDTDDDNFSHGTHVAGIAAAYSDNGLGITGMNWNAKILPVKISSSFGGISTESLAAQGIVYATDNGADVISISLTFQLGTQVLADACTYAHEKGVVIVAAAGNSPSQGVGYPAAHPEVISVGATDNRDLITTYSATGPEVTVVAPGQYILSTWDTWFEPDTYSIESGTSMSTPMVAGLASLIIEVAPWLEPAEVREIIIASAHDLGDPGFDEIFGHGRIDAGAALTMAAALTPPCYGDVTTQGTSVGDPGYGVGDGSTTAADMNYYVNLWVVGDLEADMTTQNAPIGDPEYGEPDGLISGADISYFVNFWIAGCP